MMPEFTTLELFVKVMKPLIEITEAGKIIRLVIRKLQFLNQEI